jgi:hypothetical protein
VGVDGIGQSVAETDAALRKQADFAWHQLAQRCACAARVNHAYAFPTQTEAELHRVEQKSAVQLGRLRWRERRHEARLGPARRWRLADHNQCSPHVSKQPGRSVAPIYDAKSNESFIL